MGFLFYYTATASLLFLACVVSPLWKKGLPSQQETFPPWRPAPWIPLLAIFLFKFGLIILLLVTGFTTLWADDSTRWSLSLRWSRDPWFAPQDHIWLGMSFYLFGGAMKIFPDPLLAATLAALLVSLASLYSLYFFASRLSIHQGTGLLAALLLASIPMHTWLSVMTMSDLVYMAFVGLSLGFFFNYLMHFQVGEMKKTRTSLVFLALSLVGLTASRYEGWILGGCIILFFWIHRFLCRERRKDPDWKWFTLVTVSLVLYPCLWMISSWRVLGSPLAFFANQAKMNEQYAAPFASNAPLEKILRYPRTLWGHFGSLLPLTGAGFFLAFFRARTRPIMAMGAGLCLLYFLIMEISALVAGTSMALSRCIQYVIFLCLPFAVAPLFYFRDRCNISSVWARGILSFLLGLPLLFFFLGNIPQNFSWRMRGWDGEMIALARYLQSELRSPQDFPFLEKGDKTVIWMSKDASPGDLLLKKLCGNPKRVFIERGEKIPSQLLETPNILLITFDREIPDPRWREIKRFGAYRFYRRQ